MYTHEQLHWIFVELNNSGRHGSFLTAFAKAYMCADLSNAALLHEAANKLVDKYGLSTYLANFKSTELP